MMRTLNTNFPNHYSLSDQLLLFILWRNYPSNFLRFSRSVCIRSSTFSFQTPSTYYIRYNRQYEQATAFTFLKRLLGRFKASVPWSITGHSTLKFLSWGICWNASRKECIHSHEKFSSLFSSSLFFDFLCSIFTQIKYNWQLALWFLIILPCFGYFSQFCTSFHPQYKFATSWLKIFSWFS